MRGWQTKYASFVIKTTDSQQINEKKSYQFDAFMRA